MSKKANHRSIYKKIQNEISKTENAVKEIKYIDESFQKLQRNMPSIARTNPHFKMAKDKYLGRHREASVEIGKLKGELETILKKEKLLEKKLSTRSFPHGELSKIVTSFLGANKGGSRRRTRHKRRSE
jgi:hypothetical protein